MTVLPVVERELRILARSRRLYWGRFVASLIAVILVAWFTFVFSSGSGPSMGRQIFSSVAILSFVYCLLLGSFLTADSISEEKREGTLGLLFLTDLRGYHVAFGKLTANSLQALYNLVGVFPVMAIPLLLGGLTGPEIARVALVLLVTLIFSLTTGLFVSTVSFHDRKAQVASLLLVVLVTAALPVLGEWLGHRFPKSGLGIVERLSPAFALTYAFEQNFSSAKGNNVAFWTSVLAVYLLAWLGFFASAFLVQRVWQDKPGGSSGASLLSRFRRWKHGSVEVRRRFRNALLNQNAYYWLSGRDRLKPYYVLLLLLGGGLLWLIGWLYNPTTAIEQEVFFAVACLLHTILKIWVATEAGRQFFEDRKSSALELTLSTPLPVKEILEGQFLALFRQFGPAFGIVLLFDIVGVMVAARMRLGTDTEWLLTWATIIILFLVDTVTLSAYGMWLGLTARRYSRAVVRSLFFVLMLPWLIFFGVVSYVALARLTTPDSVSFIIGIYFLIGLVTDLVIFFHASEKLSKSFREVATQRFNSAG